MTDHQRFSLRWNNYQSQLVQAFDSLLDSKDLVDVTLGVEGKKLTAHKMLLSACSPYFRELLRDNPCQHPIIILRDVSYEDVSSLLRFMYNGEVSVSQDSLNSFLKSAESLKIKGLTEEDNQDNRGDSGGGDNQIYRPVEPVAASSMMPVKRPFPPPEPSRLSAHTSSSKISRTSGADVKEEIVDLADDHSDVQHEAIESQFTDDVDDSLGSLMNDHGSGNNVQFIDS